MSNRSISEIQTQIIQEFEALSSWEDRYKRIIDIGKSLEEMPAEQMIDSNKVKGCQSNVWLVARLEGDRVILQANSDAAIVKGLVALLVRVYSGQTPDAILSHGPDFLQKIGLNTNLSQTRVNGLVSMIKQIKFYAIAFQSLLASQPPR